MKKKKRPQNVDKKTNNRFTFSFSGDMVSLFMERRIKNSHILYLSRRIQWDYNAIHWNDQIGNTGTGISVLSMSSN